MSKHWHIRCATCNCRTEFEYNHGEDLLSAILEHRQVFKGLQALAADWRISNFDFMLGEHYIDYSWIAKHADHELAIVSEYGDVFKNTSTAQRDSILELLREQSKHSEVSYQNIATVLDIPRELVAEVARKWQSAWLR
jgi:hypothetical protein